MAILSYYVDMAAAAGGDGTTAALSGAHGAFTSLAAALAALAQNLVTAGNSIVVHCAASSGGADATAPSFSATWVTDSTHYLTIQVDSANRHAGIWDSTKYRLQTSAQPVFNGPPGYTRFIGLQVLCSADDVNTPIWRAGSTGSDKSLGCQLIACIARWTDKNYSFGSQHFVDAGTDQLTAPWVIRNCLFYGGVGTHGRTGSQAILCTNSLAVVENCTIIAGATNDTAGVAVQDGFSRVRAVNVLAQGWTSFGNPAAAGTDYNAGDVAGVPGVHSRSSQAFTFVDAATAKYQLASSDAGAKGFGTDLSADASWPFGDDVTGAARSVPWDIGAFIAASSGSSDTGTGAAAEGERASGSAAQSIATTGAAGDGESASGTASVRETATGATAGGASASGAGTVRETATGAAAEGESASGSASVSGAGVTGSASEGESASGTATISEAGTGAAAEGESVSGSASVSGSGVTGSAGQGESASGTGTVSESATGASSEGESAAGAGAVADVGTGSAGEGASASGSAAVSGSGVTGTAGEGESATGTGGVAESGTGATSEGAGASGSGTVAIGAGGTAADGESAQGSGSVELPGAPRPFLFRRLYGGPAVRVTRIYAGPAVRMTRVRALPLSSVG